jgi:hypothetical protein
VWDRFISFPLGGSLQIILAQLHGKRVSQPAPASTQRSPSAEALGAYHEKKDEQREIGLGPEHDWSSHAADAFGLMAIAYRDPRELTAFHRKILNYPRMSIA